MTKHNDRVTYPIQVANDQKRTQLLAVYSLFAHYGSKVLMAGLSLGATPILIQQLGVSGYALAAAFLTVQSLVGLFDSSVTVCIARALSQHKKGSQNAPSVGTDAVFSNLACLSLLIAAGGLLLFNEAVKEIQHLSGMPEGDSQLNAVLCIATLALYPILQYYFALALATGSHLAFTIARTTWFAIRFGVSAILLIYLSNNPIAFFGCQLLAVGSVAVGLLVYLATISPPLHASRVAYKDVISATRNLVTISAVGITVLLLCQLDKLVIVKKCDTRLFAIYAGGWTLASSLRQLVEPLYFHILPQLPVAAGRLQRRLRHNAYKASSEAGLVLLLPATILGLCITPELAALYMPGIHLSDGEILLMRLLLCGMGLNSAALIPYGAIIATGSVRHLCKANLAAAIGIAFVGQFFTGLGASIAMAFNWILVNLYYHVFIIPEAEHTLLGPSCRWSTLRSLVAGAFTCFASFLLAHQILQVAIGLFGCVSPLLDAALALFVALIATLSVLPNIRATLMPTIASGIHQLTGTAMHTQTADPERVLS